MTIRYRRFFIALLILAATLFALAWSLTMLAAHHRAQVSQELQKFLGKNVKFEGFEPSFWGVLGFSAREFRIADHPRFAATPFVYAKELKLGVSALQLLLGRVVINSLTFEEPEFQVITDENGSLNISELAFRTKEITGFPRFKLRTAETEKTHPAVNFRIARIRLKRGRVDFFDRSVKEPAELQVKNIHMEVNGLDPTETTHIKLFASVAENLGRDVRIEGKLGPMGQTRGWSQQPVDLDLQFDSLHLSLLSRAIPLLRNKLPSELAVAGPLSLQAKLSGTLDQPRLTDVTLKVPFLGSPEYNVIFRGALEFAENRVWDKTRLSGMLTLDPIDIGQLRNLPFLKRTLPVTLASTGSLSLNLRFEGTWEDLRVGALIKAGDSALRYGDWFHKPWGSVADLRARISRQKNGFVLHQSELTLGQSKLVLSGTLEETPVTTLRLRLKSDSSALASWGHFVTPLAFYRPGGNVGWDLVFENIFSVETTGWNLYGRVAFFDAEFRPKESNRTIDRLNADISLKGGAAHVEKATFRLGSSLITAEAKVADLTRSVATYKLWSPQLNSADLSLFPAGQSGQVKNLTAVGKIELTGGMLVMKGTVTSPHGSLQEIDYRDLSADVTWSPSNIQFKNFSFEALNGAFNSDASWARGGQNAQRLLALTSQIDSIDLQALLNQKFPKLKSRVEGQLHLRGRLDADSKNGASTEDTFKGAGETWIKQGVFKDFNLFRRLFFGHGGLKNPSRLPPSLVPLLTRQDTRFDALKANFTVDAQRIRTDNLILSTPDYTITSAGWLDLDGETRWNGLLVFSPRLTRELQREHRDIRFLLDRRGRLSLSFRVEGKFPNAKITPANRALAQALRRVFSAQGQTSAAIGEKGEERSEKKGWLPESLENLLSP